MSVDREDYFCNNCHNEFIFDFNLNEGYSQEDIKYCQFCPPSGNRTHTLLPELDFESSASTNSATEAKGAKFIKTFSF